MSYTELNKLRNIVKQTAEAVFNNEKFTLGVLAVKAKQLVDVYPHDSTAIGMYRFLDKRANNGKDIFISRGELKDVYNKLYSNTTKFGTHFKDELGLVDTQPTNTMIRDANEGTQLMQDFQDHMESDFDHGTFNALSEDLSAVLEGKEFKPYTGKVAKLAQKTCARELNTHGLLPKKMTVVAGQPDLIICRATYDTPKGQASILIPVEIQHNTALPPQMFLSTGGFAEINKSAILGYLKETAGKQFTVNAQQLLKSISKIKNAPIKRANDVRGLINKVASKRGSKVIDMNSVILQEVDPAHPDVKLPVLEPTAQAQTVAEQLTSSAGVAEFIFGKKAVEVGRSLIIFEMKQSGYKNPQVKVISNNEDTVTYGVSINNGVGFKAPIKFANGNAVLPRVIISNGNVYSFNSEGINKLINSGDTDSKAVAQTSPLYDEKPSELINRVRQAMTQNNYDGAVNALHILKDIGDQAAYNTAYSIYTGGLMGKTAEAKTECSHPTKLGSTAAIVCSHTGLPLNKVYQDKHGHCRPLYRKGMAETSEGISTITNRIYFE